MKIFNHFILTKFNTKSFPNGSKGIEPTWLEKRFDLFDRFCYKSVRNQTNQNFKWLVFFDVNTPEVFKQKIAKYAEWENFIPLYVDCVLPYGQFPEQMRELVSKFVTDDCKYLITTWLDNDDAICKDYIQMIQDNFDRQENETINFIFGYQLNQGKVYLDYEFANHFISLVEKYEPSSFNTCLCRPHKELYEVCNSAQKIISKPSWLEVVHDTNWMNVYRRGVRIPANKVLNDFYIDPEALDRNEKLVPFLLEQARIFLLLPYTVFRKVFLRIKSHQLNDINISRFKVKQYKSV
jgi:hypothetical protein